MVSAAKVFDTEILTMVATSTGKPKYDYDLLRARAGIGEHEYIAESEFMARCHGRGFTPEEIRALRDGLIARGFF